MKNNAMKNILDRRRNKEYIKQLVERGLSLVDVQERYNGKIDDAEIKSIYMEVKHGKI